MSDRESVAKEATQDSMGGTNFSGQPNVAPQVDNREIIAALRSYMTEAQDARRNGMNPRDAKWKQNLDLYWNRVDFSRKPHGRRGRLCQRSRVMWIGSPLR